MSILVIDEGEQIPEQGQVIHGVIIRSTLKRDKRPAYVMSPRLSFFQETKASNVNLSELTGKFHKFLVESIDREKSVLTLRWLGELPAQEGWPEYYVPAWYKPPAPPLRWWQKKWGKKK